MGWGFGRNKVKIEEKMYNIVLSDFELVAPDSDIDFEQIEIQIIRGCSIINLKSELPETITKEVWSCIFVYKFVISNLFTIEGKNPATGLPAAQSKDLLITVRGLYANRTKQEILGSMNIDLGSFVGYEQYVIDEELFQPKYLGSTLSFEISVVTPKEYQSKRAKEKKQAKRSKVSRGGTKYNIDEVEEQIIQLG